jgi:hypothetical protein
VREALALEIGSRLDEKHRRSGHGPHPSLGFHRRAAFLMDRQHIEEALASITDATTAGGAAADPSAYFAGTIKKIAEREGIDLGLKPKTPPKARNGS